MDVAFVAWSRLSRRTRDLANSLNAKLVFVPSRPPYLSAFVKTWQRLREERPDIVFVQLPQGPLLWEVLRLSKALGFKVVADVHTGFIYSESLKGFILNGPFRRLLRNVDLILAHNDLQNSFMVSCLRLDKSKVITVYDPLPRKLNNLVKPRVGDLDPQNFIVLPASWAEDEPIDLAIKEFLKSRASREYRLVVTGDYGRSKRLYRRALSAVGEEGKRSVVFTGYLRKEEYYWLIENCKAVVALTNREYTMLSAIWEAVAYNKPFIVSETSAIRATVGEYPCFFQRTEGSLRDAIDKCTYNPPIGEVKGAIERLRRLSLASMERLKERLSAVGS